VAISLAEDLARKVSTGWPLRSLTFLIDQRAKRVLLLRERCACVMMSVAVSTTLVLIMYVVSQVGPNVCQSLGNLDCQVVTKLLEYQRRKGIS